MATNVSPLLALMKPTAILINASRGEVLDAAAVIVFDPEPPQASYPLLGLDNVLLTPTWPS